MSFNQGSSSRWTTIEKGKDKEKTKESTMAALKRGQFHPKSPFGGSLYGRKEPYGADLYNRRPPIGGDYYCNINSDILYD
jgi:hypothetical protein